MEKYRVEWAFTGLLKSGEYHPDHPEKDDIVSGYQNVCRIEIVKIFGLLRPPQCGERPQCGREPRIQRILILCKMIASTLWTYVRRTSFLYYHFTTLIAVICRNSVSPPDLPGNTPVSDIIKPL